MVLWHWIRLRIVQPPLFRQTQEFPITGPCERCVEMRKCESLARISVADFEDFDGLGLVKDEHAVDQSRDGVVPVAEPPCDLVDRYAAVFFILVPVGSEASFRKGIPLMRPVYMLKTDVFPRLLPCCDRVDGDFFKRLSYF